jgi:hypothetical protein
MIHLEKVSMELKNFKPVDFISNYALFDFDMDVPRGLSNAVIGAYLGKAVPHYFSLLLYM